VAEIELDVRENIATITLNAPERRNALVGAMVRELLAVCDAIDGDDKIGAVIVTGRGPTFCAGADRSVIARAQVDPAAAESYAEVSLVYDAFARIATLAPPTIAAVRGHAVGAGVNLMFSTDIRVVAEDAVIRSGFLRLGVHPGGGHFALLARAAGLDAVAGVALFGEEVDGRRAAALGLAWTAVADAEVEPTARRIASGIAKDPALARAAAHSFRLEIGPPRLAPQAGREVERAPQMWSFRRRARGAS
jgi:enoyl-CoA hydratase